MGRRFPAGVAKVKFCKAAGSTLGPRSSDPSRMSRWRRYAAVIGLGLRLVHLDTGRPRDLGPFVELRRDEGGGLFGTQAELFEAELLEVSLVARRRKDGRHRGGQRAGDVDGRIRRCRQAEDDTTAGNPSSAKVGTCGRSGERVDAATASALSLPARMFSTVVLASLMKISTSPVSKPITAGP